MKNTSQSPQPKNVNVIIMKNANKFSMNIVYVIINDDFCIEGCVFIILISIAFVW